MARLPIATAAASCRVVARLLLVRGFCQCWAPHLDVYAAHAFVYSPLWFTDLGPGARVEQSYAIGNPLVSGHWRPLRDGTGGPAAAAGQASVVSGARTVLFGTEPLFRDHPKGEFPQVARALFTVAHSGSVEESG